MTTSSSRIRRAPAAGASRSAASRLLKWAGAIPAIIAMVLIAAALAAVASQRQQALETRYAQDAEQAMQSGDFETARVCYERLLQTHDGDPAFLFGLARALENLGQRAEAGQLIQLLAPVDRPGYVPAQLVLSERLLYSPVHSAKSFDLAEQHLRRVLEADPNNLEALTMMAALTNARRTPR